MSENTNNDSEKSAARVASEDKPQGAPTWDELFPMEQWEIDAKIELERSGLRKKRVEYKEEDLEFVEYAQKLELEHREHLRTTLPKTPTEWLREFPDAINDIPLKVAEWEEVAETSKKQIRDAHSIILQKSKPEHHWYWLAALKYAFTPTRELAIANRHIERLRWLLHSSKPASKTNRWQTALEHARKQDLLQVAERYGIHASKSGNTYRALCPMHNERTPSFHIYPPSRFVCFGCDTKGDVIAFVQAMEGCSFKEAVEKLQKP